MYKSALAFTPYLSIFTEYPSLLRMSSTAIPTSLSRSQRESIIAVGEAVAATRYTDRGKQRAFLDEKTVALVHVSFLISALLALKYY